MLFFAKLSSMSFGSFMFVNSLISLELSERWVRVKYVGFSIRDFGIVVSSWSSSLSFPL